MSNPLPQTTYLENNAKLKYDKADRAKDYSRLISFF